MSSKRSFHGDEMHTSSVKQLKLENPDEFSSTVKKRLAFSTRTGQACDRCKVRKIRCDGLPGGCSPCLQNNTTCITTDRITGRATSRGYTEDLEQQIRDLQVCNKELLRRLREVGELKSPCDYHENSNSAQLFQPTVWNSNTLACLVNKISPQAETREHNPSEQNSSERTNTVKSNNLTVSDAIPRISSIRGTVLSILDMEIDVADFISEDLDVPVNKANHQSPLYNKSYQSFLQTTLNFNPRMEKMELPPISEAITYAEWYFKSLHPYLPLLHKPSTMRILHKMYDDKSFHPTVSQTVLVHMLFAIMIFHHAIRNADDPENAAQLNHRSNRHYHYCLSLFYELFSSSTFEDCQVLTLICLHMRNFPKPGASWIMVDRTMALALELNLHRSPKKVSKASHMSVLEIEMRKRVFWVLLSFHVNLSGNLGRPMRLRMEDFDCEIPESIDDEALEEGTSNSNSGCKHGIGIEAMKLIPLYIELYTVIYAVRRNRDINILTINNLEARLRSWKESLPVRLTKIQEDQGFGLYTQMFLLEFRLLLRHPSTWLPDADQVFNAESMRICVESSRQMLSVVRQIQKIKSLDTTWCKTVIYVLAITTTLYAQLEKKGESTSADISALKEEMDLWLDIMNEIGKLLGSSARLCEVIRRVYDSTLGLITRQMSQKTTSISKKVKKSIDKSVSPRFFSISTAKALNNPTHCQTFDQNHTFSNEDSRSNVVTPENILNQQVKSYQTQSQYTICPESSSSPNVLYPSLQGNTRNLVYATTPDSTESPLLNSLTTQTPQTQSLDDNSEWHHLSQNTFATQSWNQWPNTSEDFKPQGCFSTNTLIQMGERNLDSGSNTLPGDQIEDINSTSRPNVGHDRNNLALDDVDLRVTNGLATCDWQLNIY